MKALSREGRAAPPVRLLHLGLGNFFRAHQAWYTEHSPDRGDWGFAAFAGRSADLANRLAEQDGLYTLVTRAAEGDGYEVVGSVARTHTAADHAAWLGHFSSSALAVVTLTVTEAGYLRRPNGELDLENAALQGDLRALAGDPSAPVLTAPARLVAGLAARHRADGGPLAIVPCDNMAGNGAVVAGLVADLAERLDPALAEWIAVRVSFVSTTVDRITPRTEPEEAAAVLAASGRRDACPVVTEPFAEWALCGDFPAGRPGWHDAGALFTDDIAPYENRKLWLLNGAHSLLAYAGSIRGHTTVSEAIADDTCREWVEDWWAVAGPHLTQPSNVIADYCRTLLERWANPRIRHHLGQIAADGSQKLPMRPTGAAPSGTTGGFPLQLRASWPPGSVTCGVGARRYRMWTAQSSSPQHPALSRWRCAGWSASSIRSSAMTTPLRQPSSSRSTPWARSGPVSVGSCRLTRPRSRSPVQTGSCFAAIAAVSRTRRPWSSCTAAVRPVSPGAVPLLRSLSEAGSPSRSTPAAMANPTGACER